MRRIVAPREQSAIDRRMERFHAAVQDLRKLRDRFDVGHLHLIVPQKFRGAAGGEDADPLPDEFPAAFDKAGFVADADQGIHLVRMVTEKNRKEMGR